MPIGPRACYWGGYGGSLIVVDQDKDVAVAYVMNRMESGVVGDERGATILQETMKALAVASVGRSDQRLSFDLHLPARVQQPGNHDHGRGGP